MSDIKDILDNYRETPSESVWERLSERLDTEMPVRNSKSSVWKWTASALAVVAVAGGVIFGVMRHQNGNQQITAMNTTEQTVETTQQEPVAVVETHGRASLPAEDVVSVVETQNVAPLQTKESDVTVEKGKQTAVAVTSHETSMPAENVTPRTNVRQEVLPPNSTLAKQLAADPVLRTLSDENVEWTPPTHLSIPNLFTPNGDGVNDMFVIEGLEGYSSPRLVVRDKNNRVVYQSANYHNNWDGGSCPEGVYSYEFTFTYQGIENQATGKVRIIRS